MWRLPLSRSLCSRRARVMFMEEIGTKSGGYMRSRSVATQLLVLASQYQQRLAEIGAKSGGYMRSLFKCRDTASS